MENNLASLEGIPLDLLITSTRRLAEIKGVPVTVRHRGDPDNGTILLKVNLLNGSSKLYTQSRDGLGRLGWFSLTGCNAELENLVEEKLKKQGENDPDCWIIEVEDKSGHLWFPGPVFG